MTVLVRGVGWRRALDPGPGGAVLAAFCWQATVMCQRRPTTEALPHNPSYAGDYSFAFAGLQVGVKVPTPYGITIDVGVSLKQLAISTRGAINPAVYPNLAFPTFWTPMWVQPGRPLHPWGLPAPAGGRLHGLPRPPTMSASLIVEPLVCGTCCRGRQALSMNGNMYISGEISLGTSLYGEILGIELVGTGTQLMSWTGGAGYMVTISAAPNIALCGGAININLASIAQASVSLYFKYVNEKDFTLALQATLTLNPGDFLGAICAAATKPCPHEHAAQCFSCGQGPLLWTDCMQGCRTASATCSLTAHSQLGPSLQGCTNHLVPNHLGPATCYAGTVVPSLPSVVKETLNLIFNMAPIKSVDFYAGMASGWWGASMQIQGVGRIGALLGAFNIIAQEVGFPSLGSFQPRFSIAGKLTGNGLPIAIGRWSQLILI